MMSLDKKKKDIPKTKRDVIETRIISLIGTPEDMRALGDVLRQAHLMFNIDIDIDKDLPSRIKLSEKIEPDAVLYPRTAKVLRAMSKSLLDVTEEKDAEREMAVDFGNKEWMYRGVKDAPLMVKAMQSVAEGRPAAIGIPPVPRRISYGDITTQMEAMFTLPYPFNMSAAAPGGGGGPGARRLMTLFKEHLKPQWVYLQNVDIHPMSRRKARRSHDEMSELKTMEGELVLGKGYPMDLGDIDKGFLRTGKESTQGYVAVFRADASYDLKQKIKIHGGAWSKFVKKLPPSMLAGELKKKPKTLEDLLKVYFAVCVGSTLKLNNATIRPIAGGRAPIDVRAFYDAGEGKLGDPGYRKALGNKVLYSALIVGTGPYLARTHDVVGGVRNVVDIPGWN